MNRAAFLATKYGISEKSARTFRLTNPLLSELARKVLVNEIKRVGTSSAWMPAARARYRANVKPKPLLPHGTQACYARGCRCSPCSKADEVLQRYYRKRRKLSA